MNVKKNDIIISVYGEDGNIDIYIDLITKVDVDFIFSKPIFSNKIDAMNEPEGSYGSNPLTAKNVFLYSEFIQCLENLK